MLQDLPADLFAPERGQSNVHPWLSEEFARDSQALAENEDTREQHYVPRFYLARWAVDKLVQPVQIDSRQMFRPQPPKDVAKRSNFYTLPTTADTMHLPVKWIETHLGRIENECAIRFAELDSLGASKVTKASLRRDLAVFIALQHVRTPSQRARHLALIKTPMEFKREFLAIKMPHLTTDQLDSRCQQRYADDRHEAIHLMLTDANAVYKGLLNRWWAVYETASPLTTCDDPVISLAGPNSNFLWPKSRSRFLGFDYNAAVLYPIDPHHVLVMLRRDRMHRQPYFLDERDTNEINLEIVANCTKTTFERPGDNIAINMEVSENVTATPLSEEEFTTSIVEVGIEKFLERVAPRNRWINSDNPPPWPVAARWF